MPTVTQPLPTVTRRWWSLPEDAAVAMARLPAVYGVAMSTQSAASALVDDATLSPAATTTSLADKARTHSENSAETDSANPHSQLQSYSANSPSQSPSPLSVSRFPLASSRAHTLLHSPLLMRRAVALLPQLYAASDWQLLFSLSHRGADLAALYAAAAHASPALLIVRDSTGALSAAFLTQPLRPQAAFFGTARSWVAQLWPQYACYRASGANRFYTSATREHLAVGGGDNHALWLDESLRTVTSGPCRTYGSPRVTGADAATVYGLELWGFVPPGRQQQQQQQQQ